jgi:Holliday junction resolvase RusA-like endonuclease
MANWSEADLATILARRQQGHAQLRQQLVASVAETRKPGRARAEAPAMLADNVPDRSSIRIVIPGPPVAKARPRLGRGGNVYTPAETTAWERQAKFAARCQMGELPPVEGAVSVIVTAHIEPPKSWSQRKQDEACAGQIMPTSRPDIDNFLKCSLDALNEVVWVDDSQVVDATVRKRYAARPEVVVVVEMV